MKPRVVIAIAIAALGVVVGAAAGAYVLVKNRAPTDLSAMKAALVAENDAVRNPVQEQIARHSASIAPCGAYDFASRTLTVKPGFTYVSWGRGWFDMVSTEFGGANGPYCRAKLDIRHVVKQQAQQ